MADGPHWNGSGDSQRRCARCSPSSTRWTPEVFSRNRSSCAATLGSWSGTRVGAYTLDERIGCGGMGEVWLARRSDGRYEGRAAVKLLNAALLGRPAEQRFVREGSVLAKLRHPNIAQLIDAGVAPSGQPYLVLEYIDGERIDRYAEQRGLERRSARAAVPRRARRGRACAQPPRRASRSQAVEHPRDARRRREAARFRRRRVARRPTRRRAHARVGSRTHARVCGARAAAGPTGHDGDRRVRARRRAVRAADRQASVQSRGSESGPELARATLEQQPALPSTVAVDPRRARALRGDLDNIVAKALQERSGRALSRRPRHSRRTSSGSLRASPFRLGPIRSRIEPADSSAVTAAVSRRARSCSCC